MHTVRNAQCTLQTSIIFLWILNCGVYQRLIFFTILGIRINKNQLLRSKFTFCIRTMCWIFSAEKKSFTRSTNPLLMCTHSVRHSILFSITIQIGQVHFKWTWNRNKHFKTRINIKYISIGQPMTICQLLFYANVSIEFWNSFSTNTFPFVESHLCYLSSDCLDSLKQSNEIFQILDFILIDL